MDIILKDLKEQLKMDSINNLQDLTKERDELKKQLRDTRKRPIYTIKAQAIYYNKNKDNERYKQKTRQNAMAYYNKNKTIINAKRKLKYQEAKRQKLINES
jgi:hypothetical protein|tara:strand:- start:532 stop:834 length:303 start_codon:yes stop_codon:yes gene_type:complete